jgi:hypothetical protein
MDYDTPKFRLAYSRAPGLIGKTTEEVTKATDSFIRSLWRGYLNLKDDPEYYVKIRKRGGIFERMLEPDVEVERILCLGQVEDCSKCVYYLSTDGWVITDVGLAKAQKPTEPYKDWSSYSYELMSMHIKLVTAYPPITIYKQESNSRECPLYAKTVVPITKKVWDEIFERTQPIVSNYFDAREELRYMRWKQTLADAQNRDEYKYEKKGKNKKEYVDRIKAKEPPRYYLKTYNEKITEFKNTITDGRKPEEKETIEQGIDRLIRDWESFVTDIMNQYHFEEKIKGYLKDPRDEGLILY